MDERGVETGVNARRRAAFAVGRALDRSGIIPFLRSGFSTLYTLYMAKDLGAFGRGSTIHPFCVIQGARHIRIEGSVHVRAGCRIQTVEGSGAHALATQDTLRDPELLIGDRTLIGRFCHITAACHIEIGSDVLFGEGVLVTDHNHGFAEPDMAPRDQPLASARPVRIGDACWLGDHAAILPGVTLGRHVVVGANAVVAEDVGDYTVVMGIPARPVARYDPGRKAWIALAGGPGERLD